MYSIVLLTASIGITLSEISFVFANDKIYNILAFGEELIAETSEFQSLFLLVHVTKLIILFSIEKNCMRNSMISSKN